jgi:hypothetical protein
MTRYEPAKPPRFRKELIPGGYEFVIPARKNWFALLFLPVWLTFWTFGGLMAVMEFAQSHEPFLAVWLVGWLLGWIFAASTIAYMVAGSEVIRCASGDLSVGFRLFGFHRMKHFRGGEVKGLSARDGLDGFARVFGRNQMTGPFAIGRTGTVCFNHGARTVYAGERLDRAEAELIIVDLLRSIPGAA